MDEWMNGRLDGGWMLCRRFGVMSTLLRYPASEKEDVLMALTALGGWT